MFSNTDLHALYQALQIEQEAVASQIANRDQAQLIEYQSRHYYRPDIALYDIKQQLGSSNLLVQYIDTTSVYQKYLLYRSVQLRDCKISIQFEPFRDKINVDLFSAYLKHRVLYLSKDTPSVASVMYVVK